MSDVANTALPVPEASHAEPVVADISTEPAVPAGEPKDFVDPPKADATETVAADEAKSAEAAPAEEAATAEKTVEPITEGLLAYKGPGIVKSLIPSKKNFWLSDDAVTPQNLDLYLRGEKPDISHAVVAWASQTGKGLFFANKKSETDRTHPADVLALYDATDLKKQSPHEFAFKLNGHNHTFKAASDVERDGWYMSIEKAIELGKASKEDVREREGYKAELEKLSKPAAVAVAKRSQSQPKKSMEADKPAAERIGSSSGEEDEADKKQKKSRSTSRGMFNRLKGKKEEAEQKVSEKKEEKEEAKEEKKAEEATPVAESTETAPVATAVAAAEIPAAAEAAELTEQKPVEDAAVSEEKPKASKRGSIFGKIGSTWTGMRSPAKEKEHKDAELKPETTPAKDAPVSETPPVLPETAATTEPVVEPVVPTVEEPAAETKVEAPKEEVVSPGKEKTNFLSGLGFMKRNRSVSPSAKLQDTTKAEETPAADDTVIEPVTKIEEPATEAEAGQPVEKVEEPKTETSTANKRQSMLGSLGRRASKALNRMQAPKKESPAAAATEATEETTEVKPAEETPVVPDEPKVEETAEQPKSIGDVVPDAVNVGQPQHSTPVVTASA